MNGTVTSCGCALCQSQVPPSSLPTGWMSPPSPLSPLQRFPSVAALMKVRMLALIDAEQDQQHPSLCRLREAVERLEIPE